MKKTTCAKTEYAGYRWEVFDHRALDGTVHAVPVVDGEPVRPHILSEQCPCHPIKEQYQHVFYNHNVIN